MYATVFPRPDGLHMTLLPLMCGPSWTPLEPTSDTTYEGHMIHAQD